MPDTKLILASGSSIRKQMLADAGVVFEVITSHVDEDLIKSNFVKETFPERVIELSKAKAKEVSKLYPGALVIGADQICVLGNESFDKPLEFSKAVENLTKLSGKTHIQFSGACLYKDRKLIWEHSEFAELKMKSLSQEEIKAYIKLDDPLQCCGCYKFESNGSDLFEYVKGSENVIKGLALEALLEALDKYN